MAQWQNYTDKMKMIVISLEFLSDEELYDLFELIIIEINKRKSGNNRHDIK